MARGRGTTALAGCGLTRLCTSNVQRSAAGQLGAVIAVLTSLVPLDAQPQSLQGAEPIDERIALPALAAFNPVSRVDRRAAETGRVGRDQFGQPPVGLEIAHDPAGPDARARHAAWPAIQHDRRLPLGDDTAMQALEGRADPVEIAPETASERHPVASSPFLGAHGLSLPASFEGVLPCADCEGVRHHLDLWPDQHYRMVREWLGEDGQGSRRDEIGRWYADPTRGAIVLHGASEMPLFWQVMAPDRLRQMDMQGNPITSDLAYALQGDGALRPAELQTLFMLGMMSRQSDGHVFEECLSGVRFPIAGEGDFPALERAYAESSVAPGAPLLVHVEGGLRKRSAADGSVREHLTVGRFIKTVPGEGCARDAVAVALTDGYWRIDSLLDTSLAPVAGGESEPYLVLESGPAPRFRASVGCNRLMGGYERHNGSLVFGAAAATMMACPPPLDRAEKKLSEVLEMTRTARQAGRTLYLEDDDGRPIAQLTAVYRR